MRYLALISVATLVFGCNSNSGGSGLNKKSDLKLSDQGFASILRAGTVEHRRTSTLAACSSQIPNLISGAQFNSILENGGSIAGAISTPKTKSFRVDIAADPEEIRKKDGVVSCTYAEVKLDKKSIKSLQSAISKNQSSYRSAKRNFLSKRLPLVQEAIEINEKIKLLSDELKSAT